jgi:hypothetical protein
MSTVLIASIIVFSLCVLLLELMVRISTSPDLNPLNGLSSLKTNMMTSKIWSHVKTENYGVWYNSFDRGDEFSYIINGKFS